MALGLLTLAFMPPIYLFSLSKDRLNVKIFALKLVVFVLGALAFSVQAKDTASTQQEKVEQAIGRLIDKGFVIVKCERQKCINVFDDKPWYFNMQSTQDGTYIVHPLKDNVTDPDFLELSNLLKDSSK